MNQADFFHFLEVGHVNWVFSSTDDDTKIHHMMTPWIYKVICVCFRILKL